MSLLSLVLKNISERQMIYKNTFWICVSIIAESGARFIIIVWAARHFDSFGYGTLMFVFSLVTFFAVFSDMGLTDLTIREISKKSSLATHYIENIVFLKLLMGTGTCFLIIGSVFLLNGDSDTLKIAFFLGLYAVINSFSLFFHAIFRANHKMEHEALSKNLQSFSLLAITLYFVLNNASLLDISIAFFLSSAIGLVSALIIIIKNYSRFSLKINTTSCKELVKKSWPFGFSLIGVYAYETFDSIFLGIFRSKEEVGFYVAAYKVALMTTTFAYILTSSFFPLLSKKYGDGLDQMKRTADKLSKSLLIFAWPILIGSLTLADSIIITLYGEKYAASVLVFEILILSRTLVYFVLISGQIIQASNGQKTHFNITMRGAMLNIISNLVLIPPFGIYGAAFSSLMTNAYILFYMHSRAKRIVPVNHFKNSLLPIAASLPMIILIRSVHLPLLVMIPLCAALYFTLLFLLMKLDGLMLRRKTMLPRAKDEIVQHF